MSLSVSNEFLANSCFQGGDNDLASGEGLTCATIWMGCWERYRESSIIRSGETFIVLLVLQRGFSSRMEWYDYAAILYLMTTTECICKYTVNVIYVLVSINMLHCRDHSYHALMLSYERVDLTVSMKPISKSPPTLTIVDYRAIYDIWSLYNSNEILLPSWL